MRRGIGVSCNDLITKGLAELNHHMRDEHNQARHGFSGEGQGLSEEDESRINEDVHNVNGGSIELVEPQVALQRQQQQPRGPVVQWERFLPLRSLKVLLVENNDSTRHVVSGLLENCSYEVTAVENGLEAWKIIEDLTNHIDLVLTEVVIPCLSGVALLSKIKSCNTCKNIPVIMMSSNDSMGIVFKCLSKGAVDFLVKPIRKNELQNLWLHVWRKYHCSSSSVSGDGIRTQKPMKSKSIEESDNDTGSNNENDDGSVSLNLKDGSDKGSGTLSSWSKKVVEIDRPQQISLWDRLADPVDSTCAQATHSRLEEFSSNWGLSSAAAKERHIDCVAMGKDLEIGLPRNSDYPSKEVLKSAAGTEKDNVVEFHSEENGEKLEEEEEEEESLELKDEIANGGMRNETADLIMGSIVKSSNPNMEAVVNEPPNNPSKTTNINDEAIYITEELPSLGLSLKRQRDVGDTTANAHERNVLRHSELSAFSRYNTSNPNQAITWNVGNCSPLYNNSSEAAITESTHNIQSKLNKPPNQHSNDSSNNDTGSTKPLSTDKPIPRSTISIRPSAFQLVHHQQISSLHEIPTKADITISNTVLGQENANKKSVKVHHHHHHYHHHHHHVHNTQQQKQKASNDDDLSLRNMVASASHRQSDVLTGLVEGNAANYGLDRSGSGSINRNNGDNGSSGKNGNSSLAAVADGTNMASDNGVAGKYGADDMSGSGIGSRSRVDQDRLALREAALIKFRLKRKERCFEKKVRYHSRKKLAEQRPRVRGQFVRQAVNENKDTYW